MPSKAEVEQVRREVKEHWPEMPVDVVVKAVMPDATCVDDVDLMLHGWSRVFASVKRSVLKMYLPGMRLPT